MMQFYWFEQTKLTSPAENPKIKLKWDQLFCVEDEVFEIFYHDFS